MTTSSHLLCVHMLYILEAEGTYATPVLPSLTNHAKDTRQDAPACHLLMTPSQRVTFPWSYSAVLSTKIVKEYMYQSLWYLTTTGVKYPQTRAKLLMPLMHKNNGLTFQVLEVTTR